MNTAITGLRNTNQDIHILAGTDVHLWRASLDDAYDPRYESRLAPDEVARAHRYLSPLVHQRFIASRLTLRAILAQYLDVEPRNVNFQYSRQGKPSLGGQWQDHPLQFNISHSENLLVVAITLGHDVGVDVEYMRPMPEADTIAAQFFSPAEYDRYHHLPDDVKRQAFFNCWTRKEAYVKARAEGLSIPFSGFEVSFLPGEPPCLLYPENRNLQSCHMYTFSPGPDYVAALVVLRNVSCGDT